MRSSALVVALALLLGGCGGEVSASQTYHGTPAMLWGLDNAGNLSLFTEPEAGTAPVTDAIDSATSSVKMEMYFLSSKEVENALVRAAGRPGLDVWVLLDPHPMGLSNQAAFDVLTAGGVNVSWSNPKFKYTHEKALVIDGSKALIMTLNMSSGAFSRNREYGLVDENPADAKAVSDIFDADWNRTPATVSDPDLVVSPSNSRDQLTSLITGAQSSIQIEDEEFTDGQIAKILGQKAQAGVKVQVLLAGPTLDSSASGLSSEVTLLKNAGVTDIKSYTQQYLHAKLIIADGTKAYIGSVNLSANSMDNNREVGLEVQDPQILSQVGDIAASDWANGIVQ